VTEEKEMSIDDFSTEELDSIQLQMSNLVDDDINDDQNHRIVASSMEDWEQPNQVVCLEG
jgi:hypothetical protein